MLKFKIHYLHQNMNKVFNKTRSFYLRRTILLIFILLTTSQYAYSVTTTDTLLLTKISNLNDKAFEQTNINPELAYKFIDSSLTLNALDSTSYLEFSNSFTVLGILNKNKGFYQIAVSNYLKALHISEHLKDWKRVSVYYNNLGVIYYLNGKYNDALSYYKSSISIEKNIGSEEQLSIRYYNMGETHQALSNFDSSLFYFRTSLRMEQKFKSKIGINYALYGLSNLYLTEQNHDSSKFYMDLISFKNDTLNDLELECKILIVNAELAIYDKSYKMALTYVIRSRKLSEKHGYTELLISSLEKLNLIYERTFNLPKQISILKELNNIRNGRYKKHVTIKISELQKLYEQEEQEREIDKLKNAEKINEIEINHSKKVKTYLFFTVFIVILIFIFNIISLNRLRNKNN